MIWSRTIIALLFVASGDMDNEDVLVYDTGSHTRFALDSLDNHVEHAIV